MAEQNKKKMKHINPPATKQANQVKGTHPKTMKKPINKVAFLVMAPLVSLIGELLYILCVMGVMSGIKAEGNLMKCYAILLMGAGLAICLYLIEWLMEKKRDVSWITYTTGVSGIPMVITGILALWFYKLWQANQTSENLEVAKYVFLVMFIYMCVAVAFRVACHFICAFFEPAPKQ